MLITTSSKPDRLTFLDLARGLTVLLMPFIHALIIFADAKTISSTVTKPFIFIAEWPGAQLFLLIMGINFMRSRKAKFILVYARCMMLFALGYLLNILKFYLPSQLNWLPENFINDVLPTNYPSILIGDILHLAAISLPVMYLIRKSGKPIMIAAMLFVLILATSQFINYSYHGISLKAHISLLFVGKPPFTYFPFLPWFAYILAGMIIGESLMKNRSHFVWILIPLGMYMMLAGKLSTLIGESVSFYKPTALQTVQHSGFVLFWIGCWSILEKKISKSTLGTLLSFCSRNITLIYFIQWPMILMLMPVFGYQSVALLPCFTLAIACTLLTVSLAFLFTQKTTW